MIVPWHNTDYPLGFYLGDKRLFSKKFALCGCEVGLVQGINAAEVIASKPALEDGQDGYMMRGLPVEEVPDKLTDEGNFIRYTPNVYKRYFAELNTDYDTYLKSFSSKTRSTIRRKVKKFLQSSNGDVEFKSYKTATEVNEFFSIATELSSKTYQENLLGVGLPTSEEYKQEMLVQADENKIRAYLLFYDNKAVAYLFLTSRGDSLIYDYLGYDPEYMKWSVGTVLNWLAFEELFKEQTFSMLDFTEGESQQKSTFSTASLTCANTFFIKKSYVNRCFLLAHLGIDEVSKYLGNLLDKLGIKAKIRKWLRHGMTSSA